MSQTETLGSEKKYFHEKVTNKENWIAKLG
jgi:hypothetical protein